MFVAGPGYVSVTLFNIINWQNPTGGATTAKRHFIAAGLCLIMVTPPIITVEQKIPATFINIVTMSIVVCAAATDPVVVSAPAAITLFTMLL